jgi:tetratricopeptide (TPR) repeat protein
LPPAGITDPKLRAAKGPAASSNEAIQGRRREIIEKVEEMRRQTHYELLGVAATAGKEEVAEAFQRLIRRFHPDTASDPLLADIRSQMHAIALRLTEAQDVLCDPQRRAAYEAELSASRPRTVYARAVSGDRPEAESETAEAERALSAGRQLIASAKYWDAIQRIEQALPRTEPGSRLRHAMQVQLAIAFMANPKWTKRAEELLQQIVTESPSNVDAHLTLGRLYKARGLKVRAERMFRKVLEIDPKNAAAPSELAGL